MRRYLFSCVKCGKVFTCTGDCLLAEQEGEGCVCPHCSVSYGSCKVRRIKNPKLVLLAKLKRGVWIETKSKKRKRLEGWERKRRK